MNIKIIKEENDPLCTRISAGGNEEFGYYLVYRGEFNDVIKIMRAIIELARAIDVANLRLSTLEFLVKKDKECEVNNSPLCSPQVADEPDLSAIEYVYKKWHGINSHAPMAQDLFLAIEKTLRANGKL